MFYYRLKDTEYLYGYIIKIKSIDNLTYEVVFDVINDEMIKYDLSLCNAKNALGIPYFYQYTLYTKDVNLINDLKQSKLDKKMVKLVVNKNSEANGKLLLLNKSHKVSENYGLQSIKVEESEIVNDYLHNMKQLINNAFIINDDNKNYLSNIFHFGKIKSIKFSIYHVGYAHASYFTFNEKIKGFFDIGFTKHIGEDKTVKLSSIYTHRPNFIILSHWDFNHYSGVINYNPRKIFSIPWIAPIEYVETFSFFRILSLLMQYHGSLILISKDFHGYKYEDNFYLIKGIGEDINDSGLVIALRNKLKLVTLGDLDYQYLPRDFPFYDVDYLIVPHHGRHFSIGCPFKKANFKSYAIVPVGYNHSEFPNNIMLNILRNHGFTIHTTSSDYSYFGKI